MLSKERKERLIQALLFILTCITTTLAGAEWIKGGSFFYGPRQLGWEDFIDGMLFSIPFLSILTAHEFGHYFTARFHKVAVTLPFYIPLWLGFLGGMPSLGTMGAFIRIKQRIQSTKQTFDIGIAGPLAGFALALIVLFWGFASLPPVDYVFDIHPDYKEFGKDYADHVYGHAYLKAQDSLRFIGLQNTGFIPSYQKWEASISYQNFYLGKNLLFEFLRNSVASHPERVPPYEEAMHYPLLLAGFLALLFTAINLIPIGQLDGGHILFGLIGKKNHDTVSSILFIAWIFYAGIGVVNPQVSFEDNITTAILYVVFLFFTLKGLKLDSWNTMLLAAVIFALQFFIKYFLPTLQGYPSWLVFIFFLGRLLGVKHPKAIVEEKLDLNRQILGWVALLIFIISFSPQPFIIKEIFP